MTIGTCLCCIPPFIFKWEESPKLLYKRGRISKLFGVLANMAKMNGKSITMRDIQDEAGIDQIDFEKCKCVLEIKTTWAEKWKLVVLELKAIFCGKNVISLIGMYMIITPTYVCFYGITFNASDLGINSVQISVIV